MTKEINLKVSTVTPDSSAERAGIRPGDVIISINDVTISNIAALTEEMSKVAAGDHADFAILRGSELFTARLPSGPLGVMLNEIPLVTSQLERIEFLRRANQVIMTTAPSIDGHRVTSTAGIVSSEHAIGLNVIADFMASMTDIFGGESGVTQSAIQQAKAVAFNRMKVQAALLGCNAIIATSINLSEFSGQGKSMILLMAYGTAVTIEPIH